MVSAAATRLGQLAIAAVLTGGTYALGQTDFPAPTGDSSIVPAGEPGARRAPGDV